MTNDIEDAEWEEIPGNNGNLSKRSEPKGRSQGATPPAPEATPSPTLGQRIKNWAKRTLIGLGVLFLLLIAIGMMAPAPETEGTAPAAAGNAPPGPEPTEIITDAAAEPSNPINSLIVGIWISARTGGEDGQTDCESAVTNESFIRRQRGSLSLLKHDDTGRFRQVFIEFEQDVQAVTDGTWTLSGDAVSLSFDYAGVGKLTDDIDNLPGKPDLSDYPTVLKVRFDGPNVLVQTNIETGVTNRFVRCKA